MQRLGASHWQQPLPDAARLSLPRLQLHRAKREAPAPPVPALRGRRMTLTQGQQHGGCAGGARAPLWLEASRFTACVSARLPHAEGGCVPNCVRKPRASGPAGPSDGRTRSREALSPSEMPVKVTQRATTASQGSSSVQHCWIMD